MLNGAFGIMDRSKMAAGFKTHRLKYKYMNKRDPITKDLIERRARLVAAGYTLRAGIEYTETACGTMRGSSVRALLCCASIDDDDIFCGDVEKAFSQAHIDHEIYFEPPPQLNNEHEGQGNQSPHVHRGAAAVRLAVPERELREDPSAERKANHRPEHLDHPRHHRHRDDRHQGGNLQSGWTTS